MYQRRTIKDDGLSFSSYQRNLKPILKGESPLQAASRRRNYFFKTFIPFSSRLISKLWNINGWESMGLEVLSHSEKSDLRQAASLIDGVIKNRRKEWEKIKLIGPNWEKGIDRRVIMPRDSEPDISIPF